MSNNGRSRETARPDAALTLRIQRIELLRLTDPTQSKAANRSEVTAVLSDGGRERLRTSGSAGRPTGIGRRCVRPH